MTIGQAEIWYNKADNYVYPLVPPEQVFDENRLSFRMTSFQENLANIERVYELFAANNSKGHVVISFSSVPLRATFRDMNAVTANTASKSMLRAVIDAFAEAHSDRVTYFPAYEIVTVLQGTPFEDDNRHVKPEAVDKIMLLFECWFVAQQPIAALD
ncbi:MAG: GSCFA domain-containing protein [Planctomycetes bacterium]|nr:GSCFA domain-containing protein [Planctomycetota bacterium]